MSIISQYNTDIVFSVITPNYNSGEKLLRAIKSLQTNAVPYEHIIIDDASTDDSFLQVKRLKDNNADRKLVLFSNKSNMGPGVSRNKGLDVAKGQYIIFLDSDDYFLNNALDNLYNIIKSKEKMDVLLFRHYMLKDNNGDLGFSSNLNNIELVANPLRAYLLDDIISAPWCKCIRSDLAKKFRFPDLNVSEDAIYNLDIFINAKDVFKKNSILYIFDKTELNTLTRKAFSKKEFTKFEKGWGVFERKYLQDFNSSSDLELLASRKIKFTVVYYISRMMISPDNKPDSFIIGSIRRNISKNILLARKELSLKIKLLCFMFYFFPHLTIKLAKFFKVF